MGLILQRRIYRRINAQTALILLVVIQQRVQFPHNHIHRIILLCGDRLLRYEFQRMLSRCFDLLRGDSVFCQQPLAVAREQSVEHHVALRRRPLGICERRSFGGCADDACNHGRLAERQIRSALSEIHFARHLDPIHATAEVNPVHVVFENLLLGIRPLDPQRHEYLQQFSIKALPLPQRIVAVPCELLCQRAAALLLPLGRSHDRPH